MNLNPFTLIDRLVNNEARVPTIHDYIAIHSLDEGVEMMENIHEGICHFFLLDPRNTHFIYKLRDWVQCGIQDKAVEDAFDRMLHRGTPRAAIVHFMDRCGDIPETELKRVKDSNILNAHWERWLDGKIELNKWA